MWRDASSWIAEALAIFEKDWRTELRTRHALSAVLLFSITTLVTVSVTLGPLGVSEVHRPVLGVILWIILLFAAVAGLPRGFVHEEESHTATALRLAATPSALFCGKLLYSLGLLATVQALVVPLYVAMTQLPVARPGLLLVALLAGGYGLAAASTLVAAVVAQARGKGALFPILAFPLLLPLLVLAIGLTQAAILGDGDTTAVRQLLLYNAAVTVVGLMLFPVVWNP